MRERNLLADRAERLYRFLAGVQRLRVKPVRDVASYEGVLWLSALPQHPAIQAPHRLGEPEKGEPILAIDRIARREAPRPPEWLTPWLSGPYDDPARPPELWRPSVPSSPPGIELADGEPVAGGPAADELAAAGPPDLQERYAIWRSTWEEWAAQALVDQAVRDRYAELYAMYARTVGTPEAVEAVLGIGCLTWLSSSQAAVRRHLLTVPVSIRFDDESGLLTVEQAESLTPVTVELDMLDPAFSATPEVTAVKDDAAEALIEHPLRRGDLSPFARRLVHLLGAAGEYRDDDEPGDPSAHPVAAFAPAIILRRRSQTGMVKVLDDIAAHLADAAEVPAGILPLVDPERRPAPSEAPVLGAAIAVDGDTFLPLPVNPKQLEIVERVDRRAQTLVQGPPGTGKTHTAAVLIAHLLAQGKRVLVTAQTDRALKEVQRKLPDEIRPLSVAVVGASREDTANLSAAVERIAATLDEYDEMAAQGEVERCLASIEELRSQRARVNGLLVDLREREVAQHERGRYRGTMSSIAQQLRAESADYGWLDRVGAVAAGEPLPVAPADVAEWYGYLVDQLVIEHEEEARHPLPDPEELLDPEVFADLLAKQQALRSADESNAALRRHPAFESLLRLSRTDRERVRLGVERLAEAVDELGRRPETWMAAALADVRAGRPAQWQTRLRTIEKLVGDVTPLVDSLGPMTEVTVLGGEIGPLVAVATAVRDYLGTGGTIKIMPDGSPKIGTFTSKLLKQSTELFDHVRVNGTPPARADQLAAFLAWAQAGRILDALDRAWPAGSSIPHEDVLRARLDWHIEELRALQSVVAFADLLVTEARTLAGLGVSAADWGDRGSAYEYGQLVQAAIIADDLAEVDGVLAEVETVIGKFARWSDAAPCVSQLRDAVEQRDHNAYAEAHQRIAVLAQVRARLARRDELRDQLRAAARPLTDAVEVTSTDPAWPERIARLDLAWGWAQTLAWLRDLESHDINELQSHVQALEERIRQEVEALAATRAWAHAVAPDRISATTRADLMAYVQLVRRLGKGTGKYATGRRSEIRKALDRCRSAVPVWIMPIYRVVEQVTVRPDMFDVVIVDEASQAGVESTFLQFLAPKIVIIGDDKQVSPLAVGQDQQQVIDLAAQYLYDDPYRATWQDPRRSLFDEAKMRYGDMITLTEHRRCVPEIIGFSNRIAYEPQGISLVPVRQFGADRLEPIKPVFVDSGHVRGSREKINPPEIDALVQQLEACLADPRYDGLTFGVISLQGTAQASAIENRLLERISPTEWVARDLRCGDSADFQGSERDVVFLSMVVARQDGERIYPLTKDENVQRFNVAASRAKDQMWLFHSVHVSDLANQEDVRFQLLDHCIGVAARPAGDLAGVVRSAVSDGVPDDRFGSLFDQRVFNHLNSRGYTVIPQFRALGYRIDLVVVGAKTRLAVECEGDSWQGPEAYGRDLARQRDLERCGWKFHRIRESAFYANPESELDALWAALAEQGIYPPSQSVPEWPEPGADVFPPVDARIGLEPNAQPMPDDRQDGADR